MPSPDPVPRRQTPRRILLAGLKQESAVFNPVNARYGDFKIRRGAQIPRTLAPTRTEVAGALKTFAAHGAVQVVPAWMGWSVSGGPVDDADLDRLVVELTDAVAAAGSVDGAYIVLHGAMAGRQEMDPEGRLLARIRELIGPVPLVISLDLHAVLTDAMLDAADLAFPFHTYPHVDQFETGQRAAAGLLRLLEDRVRPVTVRVPLPMLVRGDELLTASGRFGRAIRLCQALENHPAGMAAGVLIGNPFTDVPELCTNVLVSMAGDRDRAERVAVRIARFMWHHRHRFQAPLTSLSRALDMAAATPGLTVFSDAADATSSGAPGDSNAVLRALLASGYRKRALFTLVDAATVARASAVGAGNAASFSLGGTLDPGRHRPLSCQAHVRALTDGQFRYADETPEDAGRTAVLVIDDRVYVVITERPVHIMDRSLFEAHGLPPDQFDLVVVKSPNGFRPFYEHLASRIVAVDAPGATSANLRSLPYRRVARPIFPLDPDSGFAPQPSVREPQPGAREPQSNSRNVPPM